MSSPCYCTGACRETGVCPHADKTIPMVPSDHTELPDIKVTPTKWPFSEELRKRQEIGRVLREPNPTVMQGWQCPKCQTIHSPYTASCYCQGFRVTCSMGGEG